MGHRAKPYAERAAAEVRSANPVVIADLGSFTLTRFERLLLDDLAQNYLEPIRRDFLRWTPTIILHDSSRDFIVATAGQLAPAIAALRRAERREKAAR